MGKLFSDLYRNDKIDNAAQMLELLRKGKYPFVMDTPIGDAEDQARIIARFVSIITGRDFPSSDYTNDSDSTSDWESEDYSSDELPELE